MVTAGREEVTVCDVLQDRELLMHSLLTQRWMSQASHIRDTRLNFVQSETLLEFIRGKLVSLYGGGGGLELFCGVSGCCQIIKSHYIRN